VAFDSGNDNRSEILGASGPIKRLQGLISQCADSDAAVLIRGESGSGKELVSRALHQQSHRYTQAFVAINCGAIPAQLLESELFGHMKGSFTGATCDRVGRFELAHNGTLFLDEIGDMPPDLQVKFLRVLEEKAVEPVGGSKSIDVDVRVIAATHRDLEVMVSEGKFREDLFYRLNILPITVPPLRDRSTDIQELLGHFATHFSLGKRPISFSRRSLHLLQSYSWPGNVRELRNLVQRLSVLYPEKKLELANIPMDFLPAELKALSEQLTTLGGSLGPNEPVFVAGPEAAEGPIESLALEPESLNDNNFIVNDLEKIIELSDSIQNIPEEGITAKDIINDLEANLIRTALVQTSGNVSKASQLLSIGRTSLIQKIAKYEIIVTE
jgi:sigma-54 specific flagellar transcriptional regulator A